MQRFVLILLWAASYVIAQAPRTFEVASIHEHPDAPHRIGVSTSGTRLRADAAMARVLILYAYGVKGFEVADSPRSGVLAIPISTSTPKPVAISNRATRSSARCCSSCSSIDSS
jgi:hypothetical protein